MMGFDVMRDPWIPVIVSNKKTKVGIRECLVGAQGIKRIPSVSHLNILNYCIQSFLIDIAQDIFHPKDIDDILDLYEKGSFDASKVDNYINRCEIEGFSFDVFDQYRPFLQCPRDQLENCGIKDLKKGVMSVASLGHMYESGNNSTFIHRKNQISYKEYANLIHDETASAYPLGVDLYGLKKSIALEDTVSMDITQYIISLIYMAFCNQASGSGHKASVTVTGPSGFHPIFVINEGENLFQTILASMGTVPEKFYKKMKPMWRREEYVPDIPNMLSDLGNGGWMSYSYYPTQCIFPLKAENKIQRVVNKALEFQGNDHSPKALYSAWVNGYPRIIRQANQENKGVYAMVYSHNDYQNSRLKTMMMDLAGCSDQCTILKENYPELRKEFGLKLKVNYYAYAHSSAYKPSNIDCQETFQWNMKDILDSDEQIRLRKFVGWLKNETIQLGRTLSMMDAEAVGAGKDWKINGEKITKVTAPAAKCSNQYVREMEWKLLHVYRDRFKEEDDKLEQDIEKEIRESALTYTKEYRIARNDIITKAKYMAQLTAYDFTNSKEG